MENPDLITIEIAYAKPSEQVLLSIQVSPETNIKQALEKSAILERFPEIDLEKENKIGIFGKVVSLTQLLRDRDRIEIYRPLIADPNEVRKQRAADGKKLKKGDL
jgi:putative ubiquitin-RnfH superfamily antitoxin RatB of RatAB toxin-antitoxin module